MSAQSAVVKTGMGSIVPGKAWSYSSPTGFFLDPPFPSRKGGPALFSGLQVVARVRSSLELTGERMGESYSNLIRSFLLWCWKEPKGLTHAGDHSPQPEGAGRGAD